MSIGSRAKASSDVARIQAELTAVAATVTAAQLSDDTAALGEALGQQGRLLMQTGQAKEALEALLLAIGLCPPDDAACQARLWQSAARAQRDLACYSEALEYLGVGLRLLSEAGDIAGQIDLLEDLAEMQGDLGEVQAALSSFEVNLSLRLALPQQPGLALTYLRVGKTRLQQPEPQLEGAVSALECARDLAQQQGDVVLLGRAYGWLGHAHWRAGTLDAAEDAALRSQHIFSQLGDTYRLGLGLLDHARICAAGKRHVQAQYLAQQALALAESALDQSGARELMVQAHQLLSEQAETLGQYQAALRHQREYHRLEFERWQSQNLERSRQVAARIGLSSSRQETQLYRERGSELERLVAERTAEIEASRVEMIELLASAAEFRDAPLGLHARWVGEASAALALELGWDAASARDLGLAARLHDIGKLAISDAVLLKTSDLSAEEWVQMQSHTTQGAKLLSHSRSALLELAAEVALSHHERWDGAGYPQALGAEQVPWSGRIVAVADTFDALLSVRPYKEAWSVARARAYLQQEAGRRFDPAVVAALLLLEAAGKLPVRE